MSPSRPRSRIAVLSRKRSLYSTARLAEAIKKRGHHPTVLDTLKCTMLLGPQGPKMHYRGAEVSDLLVAIPRIGASVTGYGVKVANHFRTCDAVALVAKV